MDTFAGPHEHNGIRFEVFYDPNGLEMGRGAWRWSVAGQEACSGPFPTAEGAYLAAIGD